MSISAQEIKDTSERWKHYDNNTWGVFTPIALHYGLSAKQCGLLKHVNLAVDHFDKWERYEKDGIIYVWINFATVLERMPLMEFTNVHSVSNLVKSLKEKGVIRTERWMAAGLSKTFIGIPVSIKKFLFPFDGFSNGLSYEYLAEQWLRYIKEGIEYTGNIVDGNNCFSGDDASDKSFSTVDNDNFFNPQENTTFTERFVGFLEKAKQASGLEQPLYKQDGTPYASALGLQKDYESMLDGTFYERRKPTSNKYDLTHLGKVTEDEMLIALKYPKHNKTVAECFYHYNTKGSAVANGVMIQREGYKDDKGKAPIDSVPKDDAEFNKFLHYLIQLNTMKYVPTDADVVGFWKLHEWYKRNAEELSEINKGKVSKSYFKKGLRDQFGEYVARYITVTRTIPRDLSQLSATHPWWIAVCKYAYKHYGNLKMLLDDGVYRRIDEDIDSRERLLELRAFGIGESFENHEF